MNTKEIFPVRLINARKMRKLSQKELGEKADIPSTSIAHFEAGARLPCVENVVKLALALNVSTDNLLGMPSFTRYADDLSNEQIETINCLVKHWRKKQ